MQGETIPPVYANVGEFDSGEPVFLQAEEEINVRRSVQTMRGNVTPIVQEQQQLRQDVEDLASEAASVLYNTAARSAQSVAELRQDTGAALSQAEAAIGQVGSSVQTLGLQMNEIASEQREFLERALTAERRAETLAQQLHDSRMEQEAMLVALEHQKADQTQKQQFLEQELVRQRQRHATMQESVDNVTRDRDDVRKEVQTLSTQLQQALNQIGDLTVQLARQPRPQMVQPQMSQPQVPEVPQQRVDIPEFQWGPTPSWQMTTGPEITPVTAAELRPGQFEPAIQMRGPSFDRTGTLHFAEQREVEEEDQDRMSQYLWEQSSIAGFSMEPLGSTENDVRTADWISEHASIDGSRRSGSAAVSPPLGRADCGMPEGCGTEGSPVRFKIDLKPKDPPVFAGKATDDVDIWVKQVSNFLTIIGGPDHIQVAYVANLLQGAAQHWFQRECDAGRHPRTWRELGQALRHRFGNDTKTEQAQSQIMSMQQGKNETAHDYALRFETVLEKIPQYEESWVRNLFVWGLHSHLATQVNMQNPATLNRAIQLAKKADVAIQLSRRPGASGSSSSQQQKTKAAGAKPNTVNAGHSRGSFYTGQKQKPNKNFYYRGQSSGNPTRGGYRPQVTQTAPPPPRVVPINPGPQRGGGPGPRRGGRGNQRRPRTAGVRVIQEDRVMEQEVMAGQQGQGSGQQPERKGTTVSQRQRQGN